jgi:hypothetical protein
MLGGIIVFSVIFVLIANARYTVSLCCFTNKDIHAQNRRFTDQPNQPSNLTMACYRIQDLFSLHIRLYAGIVDRYIDPSIDLPHGFKHAIAIGLDDWARLSLVGPRQPPYALLLTYIADLRRSIPELFDIYHTNFQALGPIKVFIDEVIAHSYAVEASILNGLERFNDFVYDAIACIERDVEHGYCRLNECRDTQDAIITHALECFRMVVKGALDSHHGFVGFRCHYLRCICDSLYCDHAKYQI